MDICLWWWQFSAESNREKWVTKFQIGLPVTCQGENTANSLYISTTNLTFMCPCIVTIIVIVDQQDATILIYLFIYLFILFIYLLLGINKSIKIVASCWSRIQFHNTMVKYPTEHYTALREAERNPLLERWFVPWFIDLGEAYLQVVDPESRCLTVLAWHYQDVIHVSSSTT